MTGNDYPPAHHVLRDLDFDVHVLDEHHLVARFLPGHPTGAAGPTELGGVVTVVDLLAGSLGLSVVTPDWLATSGLSLHLTRPLPPGELELVARLVRAGRNTLTVEVAVRAAGEDDRVAEGMVSFARIARRQANPLLEGGHLERGTRFSFPASEDVRIGSAGSLRAAIGCRVAVANAGVTETPLDPYVRNSFGAMNGGVVGTVIEAAALAWADARSLGDGYVSDLVVNYLTQGRAGPVRTVAESVGHPVPPGRTPPGRSVLRVEVDDAGGEDGNAMAVAHVVVAHRN